MKLFPAKCHERNYDVKQETVHCYPRNVDRCSTSFVNSRFSSVMWSKLKIVPVQKIYSRIWDMIDDCSINNLAKNQVSAVFNSRAIRRSVSSKFYRDLYGTPCWCPSRWAPTWRPETSVTEFCYKSVNLSLEELKNIKIILFLIQELVQIAKFPETSPELSHFSTNSAVM